MKRLSTRERDAMGRELGRMIEAAPGVLLAAIDLVVNAMQPGRAGLLLIRGGLEETRISVLRADGHEASDSLVAAFDERFGKVCPLQDLGDVDDDPSVVLRPWPGADGRH